MSPGGAVVRVESAEDSDRRRRRAPHRGDHRPAVSRDHHDPRFGRLTLPIPRTDAAVGTLGAVRAMASDITLYGWSAARLQPVVDQALAVFTSVQEACTRFDQESPLMRANARPDEWHTVPLVLLAAVRAAHRPYQLTDGRFDPRILDDLVRLGYDRSLPFADGDVATDAVEASRGPLPRWTPQFRYGRRPELHLGGIPIDLGGIGKSLAVRWATEVLMEHLDAFRLDAGGDC